MISVGIIGGSGYAGKTLVKFCNLHPNVENFKVYGFSSAKQTLLDLFPELMGTINNSVIESINDLSFLHDIYFVALPHGEALNYIPALIEAGKKVIDLGGDYRLDSEEEYLAWYKIKHTSPYLLKEKVYGLADITGSNYSGKELIANPGCYPTAASLALIPFIESFNTEIISISVSAYSGTSGAGKTPKQELLMSEMDGNVSAYNLNSHRHQPEILQTLKKYGFKSHFSFATHLLPAAVGIYSTSFIHLNASISADEIKEKYKDFYDESFFIRLRETPPKLSWVAGTNFCDINISIKDRTVIITSAIDNLIKGASGQAVQNMNKLFGWEETAGLLIKGVDYAQVY